MSTSCLQTHSTLYPSSSFAVGKKLRPRGKDVICSWESQQMEVGGPNWRKFVSPPIFCLGPCTLNGRDGLMLIKLPGAPRADRSRLQGGWQLRHLKRSRAGRTPGLTMAGLLPKILPTFSVICEFPPVGQRKRPGVKMPATDPATCRGSP